MATTPFTVTALNPVTDQVVAYDVAAESKAHAEQEAHAAGLAGATARPKDPASEPQPKMSENVAGLVPTPPVGPAILA